MLQSFETCDSFFRSTLGGELRGFVNCLLPHIFVSLTVSVNIYHVISVIVQNRRTPIELPSVICDFPVLLRVVSVIISACDLSVLRLIFSVGMIQSWDSLAFFEELQP